MNDSALSNREQYAITTSEILSFLYSSGCGWDSERKAIYFTVDGEDLSDAFSNVQFSSNERLLPAVGCKCDI